MKKINVLKKSMVVALAVLVASMKLGSTVEATEIGSVKDIADTLEIVEISELTVGEEISEDVIQLAEVGEVQDTDMLRTIVVNIGETRSELAFTWIGVSEKESFVEISKGGIVLTTVNATQTDCSNTIGGYSYSARLDCFTQPGAYTYRVGNDDAWSEPKQIGIGVEDNTYSFLLSGDPQIYSSQIESDTAGWMNTINLANTWFGEEISFLMTLGDQVNADRRGYLENEYDALTAPEFIGELPMAMNVGNHDVYTYSTYTEHFTVPENVDSANTASASSGNQSGDYWFAYEGTLYISLNSNITSTALHIAFMEQAIAEYTSRFGEPTWKIVSFHHSIYSSASHHDDADIIVRRNELSPEFSRLNIDVVLMGHDHVHTRSVMMQGTTPTTEPDYLTEEALSSVTDPEEGEVLYLTLNSGTGSKFYDIENYELEYVAFKNQENIANITKVDVSDNALVFTTYRTTLGSQKDDVVDTFSILRTIEEDAPQVEGEDDLNSENDLEVEVQPEVEKELEEAEDLVSTPDENTELEDHTIDTTEVIPTVETGDATNLILVFTTLVLSMIGIINGRRRNKLS